jgi:hypothetical protein
MASDWLFYVLITLCLTFVGISAMQFLYVFYLESVTKQHKKYIKELEHRVMYLNDRLFETEIKLKYPEAALESEFVEDKDEVWADVIED